MKFRLVLGEVFRLCWRTRFILSVMMFSFVIHYLGLAIPKQATLSFQGVITEVGPRQSMFISVYLSVFIVFFLSVVFALWLVPYFHQGDRALLIFVWPVSKWIFPLAYGTQLFFLILLEWFMMLGLFGFSFGWDQLFNPDFFTRGLLLCFCLQAISAQAVLFLLSSFTLLWGPFTTLFLSAAGFIGLQVLATLDRMGFLLALFEQGSSLARFLILLNRLTPPLGAMVFDLRDAFFKESLSFSPFLLWMVWVVLGAVFFRWMIARPKKQVISGG